MAHFSVVIVSKNLKSQGLFDSEGRSLSDMSILNLPFFAGIVSSTIFSIANIPMLVKIYKTKDVESYSLAYLMFCNVGNIVHWIYILSLPLGPIWMLHTFSTITSFFMLYCYCKYKKRRSSKISVE